MKTLRKGSNIKKEVRKAAECGNFVATPRGPGNCCNNKVGYCCNA